MSRYARPIRGHGLCNGTNYGKRPIRGRELIEEIQYVQCNPNLISRQAFKL